ncbi:MAG TPA: thiamine pyrophosphate-dependent enzyme, partial [Vicinamibacterales bacterium]|nr:thiamine pyrophosphate-dependent enzyme [Vicinamibacterales bacterium]
YGHNEGDEPAFTQPQIYQIVAAHPTVREKYAQTLIAAGEMTQEDVDRLVQQRMDVLERAYASVKPEQDYVPPVPHVPPSGAAKNARTAVAMTTLQAINAELLKVP